MKNLICSFTAVFLTFNMANAQLSNESTEDWTIAALELSPVENLNEYLTTDLTGIPHGSLELTPFKTIDANIGIYGLLSDNRTYSVPSALHTGTQYNLNVDARDRWLSTDKATKVNGYSKGNLRDTDVEEIMYLAQKSEVEIGYDLVIPEPETDLTYQSLAKPINREPLVDELEVPLLSEYQIVTYPSTSGELLVFELVEHDDALISDIKVFDIDGKTISVPLIRVGSKTFIDISCLSPTQYLFQAYNEHNEILNAGSFNVSK